MRRIKNNLTKFKLEEMVEPQREHTVGDTYTDKKMPEYVYLVAEDEFGKYFRVFRKREKSYEYEEIGYDNLYSRELEKIDYIYTDYRGSTMFTEVPKIEKREE